MSSKPLIPQGFSLETAQIIIAQVYDTTVIIKPRSATSVGTTHPTRASTGQTTVKKKRSPQSRLESVLGHVGSMAGHGSIDCPGDRQIAPREGEV